MCVHVWPPSVDFHTPLPHDTLWRLEASPVPIQTRFGFVCEIVTSPIAMLPLSWNKASNVVPLFTVFHTPPWAVAT